MSDNQNTQQPVAWRDEAEACANVMHYLGATDAEDVQSDTLELRFEGENGCEYGSDVSIVEWAERTGRLLDSLLAAPPVPRDVLMAALGDCRAECAKHYLGDADESVINLAAIADRYASKVPPVWIADDAIAEGLKLHKLAHDKPSQLADAFRIGAKWAVTRQPVLLQPASAKPVVVPDEMNIPQSHNGEYSVGWARGWNDCRAAMLSAAKKPEGVE